MYINYWAWNLFCLKNYTFLRSFDLRELLNCLNLQTRLHDIFPKMYYFITKLILIINQINNYLICDIKFRLAFIYNLRKELLQNNML